MDFLLPPSPQSQAINYAGERQIRPIADLSSPWLNSLTDKSVNNSLNDLPIEVRSQLEQFLETFPDPDAIARQLLEPQLIAQRGPIKVNGIPKLKPSDKPRLVLPRKDNTENVGKDVGKAPQDIKPVLVKLSPLLRNLLKVVSDRQEYDLNTQIFVAEGNVLIRYKKSELKADRVQLNTKTQQVIAEGNVFFTRGDQKIRGSRLVYNYSDVKGELLNASGAVDLGNVVNSEVSRSPSELATNSVTLSVAGTGNASEGQVRRLGFIAERLILDGEVWTAENLRVTNDPFSPPELELVTPKATLTPISPTKSILELESPRIVFDQGFSLPLPINSITLDRFQRFTPALVGFDRRDRDGAFYQQSFDVVSEPNISIQLAPQLLLQRAFSSQKGLLGFDVLGVVATLNGAFDDGQKLSARAGFSGLDFSKLDSVLRFNASHEIPIFGDFTLLSQYAFRDRVYNGSLGFQDVNNIIGSTLLSPKYMLGDSQISLNYQVAAQIIGATRDDVEPVTVGTLMRLQSAVALGRSFPLLQGQAAPATRESGLRFSPKPVTPKLDAYVNVQGVNSLYSNGATQSALFGTLGLLAEVGNFSKDFFDYTGLNLSYTQAFSSGKSPFLFDRIADNRAFTFGIIQQIYGPIRVGIQHSWSLDTGNVFDSVYSLEYARRTYAFVVRYNPTQGLGEILLRISDFNWTRPPNNVTNVENGLEIR
jgi:lipopolysaccharide export system protein LptA